MHYVTVALHLNPTLKLLSQFFEAMLNNLHTFQANILSFFTVLNNITNKYTK